MKTVLSCDFELILREFLVTDTPILLVILIFLLQVWRCELIKIMHIINALSVLDNSYPIWLCNSIFYVFGVFPIDITIFPLDAIFYIKPQLFIKVLSLVRPASGITFILTDVYISPCLELLHGIIILRPECTLITSITLNCLFASQQYPSTFLYLLQIVCANCMYYLDIGQSCM